MAALDLDISPESVAAATLARHRRMALRNGTDPAVVDSPAYRALLTRSVPADVAVHIARRSTK